MDFVAHQREVVPQAEVHQRFEFAAIICAARRVLRTAQQQRTCRWPHRRFEPVDIHDPAAAFANQVDKDGLLSRIGGHGQERVVDRDGYQEALTRSADSASGEVETGNDARQPDEPVSGNGPAETVQQPRHKGILQCGRRLRVSENAVTEALFHRRKQSRRRLEVHVGHPERQDFGAVKDPLGARGSRALDDRIEVVGHGFCRNPEGNGLLEAYSSPFFSVPATARSFGALS